MPEEFWIFMGLGLILFFAGLVTGRIVCRVEDANYATLIVESLNKISQLEDHLESTNLIAEYGLDSRDKFTDLFVKMKAENKALREYATHKPGCHENGNECICGLDALLTDKEWVHPMTLGECVDTEESGED